MKAETTHTLPDVLCLSHLRWDLVFQRPHHFMTRWAREARVFFVEEPVRDARREPSFRIERRGSVRLVVPHLPENAHPHVETTMMRSLLNQLVGEMQVVDPALWYYTPMALSFSSHLPARFVVYDCMDELSAFHNAPKDLVRREVDLMGRADLVLTGGHSLFEAKRDRHHNIHAVPSSVDAAHFGIARTTAQEPADQAMLPHPRFGFFGVIDERMDLDLVRGIATLRPDWQFVFIGPVVKIDPSVLPNLPNIHYLGRRRYEELPAYLSGWDVALLPFARNDATRFISPTKTPEYMAAGRPVVSTSIRDVVRPYGEQGYVRIADDPESFVRACEEALAEDAAARTARADQFLENISWDSTWARVRSLCVAAQPRGLRPMVDRRAVADQPRVTAQ